MPSIHNHRPTAGSAAGPQELVRRAGRSFGGLHRPEVAWVGLTENKAKGVKYGRGVFPWAAFGWDEGMSEWVAIKACLQNFF